MAGYPDEVKRDIIRRYLLSPEGRGSSDHEASRQCLCSRSLVSHVRRLLIVSGELPETRIVRIGRDGKGEVEVRYIMSGGTPRGGYTFAADGKIVPKAKVKKRKTKPK